MPSSDDIAQPAVEGRWNAGAFGVARRFAVKGVHSASGHELPGRLCGRSAAIPVQAYSETQRALLPPDRRAPRPDKDGDNSDRSGHVRRRRQPVPGPVNDFVRT